jgi:hypothetical protein
MLPQGLGGEADPNSWDFVAPHGPLPNPVGHTFPLLTHDSAGVWRLIGTGFYISGDGLFVTAKHVIEEVWVQDRQVCPLVILHLCSDSGLFGPQEYLLRPLMQCWVGDRADVALGVAAQVTHNVTGEILSHWSWPLSWTEPETAVRASTYAFPNHSIELTGTHQTFHFQPDLYSGIIQEAGNFRDRVLVPYAYMHVDFRIHGAASGGPVVGPNGSVIGVNCRYMEPNGPGVTAQIRCLEGAYIDDVVLTREDTPRRITFSELVSAGAVKVTDYVPSAVAPQTGHTLRFTLPVTAPAPSLQMTLYV